MGNGIILTRNLTEQKVRCKRRKFYDGYECLGTWGIVLADQGAEPSMPYQGYDYQPFSCGSFLTGQRNATTKEGIGGKLIAPLNGVAKGTPLPHDFAKQSVKDDVAGKTASASGTVITNR